MGDVRAMTSLDRRTFLKIGGAGLAGVAFAPLVSGCTSGIVDPVLTLDGFTPFITPTSQFYIQYGGRDTIEGWTMPDITREAWQLAITGEILNPMTLTWADIDAAVEDNAKRTILKTMRCVLDSHVRPGALGWTGNAYWGGIPLRYFLNRAKIDRDNAKRIVFSGYDGFSNNITLDRFGVSDLGAMEPLLVFEMNGEPLSREHGGPLRLMLLETYGFKNVKWLKTINASLFDRPTGQYQREGFVDDGIIRVASRSENITESLTVPAGKIEITGYALSGYGEVNRVEISIDDAPFISVTIDPFETQFGSVTLPRDIFQLEDRKAYPYVGVWTKWRYRWDAPIGRHTVAIRAIDSEGNTQPDEDFEIKDGQAGVVRYNITVA